MTIRKAESRLAEIFSSLRILIRTKDQYQLIANVFEAKRPAVDLRHVLALMGGDTQKRDQVRRMLAHAVEATVDTIPRTHPAMRIRLSVYAVGLYLDT